MKTNIRRGHFRNPSWLRFDVLENRLLLTGSPINGELAHLLAPVDLNSALVAVLNSPATVVSYQGTDNAAASPDPGLTGDDQGAAGLVDSNSTGQNSADSSSLGEGNGTGSGSSRGSSDQSSVSTISVASGTGSLRKKPTAIATDPAPVSPSPVVFSRPRPVDDGRGTAGSDKDKNDSSGNDYHQTQPGNTPSDENANNQSRNDASNNADQPPGQAFDASGIMQAMMQWEKDKGPLPIAPQYTMFNVRTENIQTTSRTEPTALSAEAKDGSMKGGLSSEENQAPNREPEIPAQQANVVASENRESGESTMSPKSVVVHLNPQGAGLLASVPAIDLVALEQGVLGFFEQLDGFGSRIAQAQEKTGLPSWLVALAAGGVVLEITRRQIKAARVEAELADNCQDQTWPWLVEAADPQSPVLQ